MKTNSKGFTLIELLVVIAIIGILSTIAMTSLNGARKKAADASFKSTVSSLQAIGVLCCDSATNAHINTVANAAVCADTSIAGKYPTTTSIGTITRTDCSAGDFEIIVQAPASFSGTLVAGGCNATTCNFCSTAACDPI